MQLGVYLPKHFQTSTPHWFITYMQLGGAYMPIIRKSPEKILEQIHIEEHESKRGKLKIFLAMQQVLVKLMLC